ncbi:hypothetical protein [Mycoplasmopsis cynos]|uniref:hypothetical protein n=1 Tax=Mycoplasmopsis cynos TaxID=171284 RepID=UPI00220F2031|nr:hypothetical protein [Mycoplasmopsis cynos]UWV77411.1 hypothetical protein NW070_00195 [Mycoplasmopsis cynos]UWV92120.1 hypothetical protein NWE57_04270 [Mycoplasmopsis cynos]
MNNVSSLPVVCKLNPPARSFEIKTCARPLVNLSSGLVNNVLIQLVNLSLIVLAWSPLNNVFKASNQLSLVW